VCTYPFLRLEEFFIPLGISQNKLARDIDVPPRRINEIVHGLRADASNARKSGHYRDDRRGHSNSCVKAKAR
jgi:hypothetical protein